MAEISKAKQIKLVREENKRLRMFLRIIMSQDECFNYGKHIDCKTIANLTDEDKRFESRLADNLCAHCLARFALTETQ